MTDWKRRIPTIMTSQELIDRAFARASRTEVPGAAPFDSVKKTNIAKINSIGDMTVTTLLKYVRAFPRMEKEDEFFSQLVDVIIGMDDHAPVTGIPMGIIQTSLLISSVGMALVLAHGLWRQLTGRMSKDELVPYSGSVGE